MKPQTVDDFRRLTIQLREAWDGQRVYVQKKAPGERNAGKATKRP